MSVRTIDGYVVDAIESLRAEWLYSQGRGRHFRVGDQQELSQYLATVCPLSGEALETEEDRKLRLILSKAQHHQQQLRDQEINPETCGSPITRKKLQSSKYSPRLAARLNSKPVDLMTSSCYSSNNSTSSPVMTKSLDPSILSHNVTPKSNDYNINDHQNGIVEKCLEDISSPLQALSKLVPVPESLMSPDYRPMALGNRIHSSNNRTSSKIMQPSHSPKPSRIATIKPKILNDSCKKSNTSPNQQRKYLQNSQSKQFEKSTEVNIKKSLSSEDESEICPTKLQMIQIKVEKHRQKDAELCPTTEDRVENAAIYIQKMWRGYHVRNKNKYVQELFKSLQSQRSEQYIQKLASDMESTKVALESERKIQMLQMQAINALWKKVCTIHSDGETSGNVLQSTTSALENTEIVKDLAETCNMLHSQVQQLQGSMQDIIKFMSTFGQIPTIQQHMKENAIATQTEISAVHTPQGDAGKIFPFQKQMRPSSLPLPVSQRKQSTPSNGEIITNQELKQFAGTLVDGVIKTVSETKSDTLDDAFEQAE